MAVPVVRPAATSWGAVLGGWVATVGASVIFAPLVAGLVAAVGEPNNANQLALAAPVVFGILISYLVGGYVAGRMAGYRTSWHGMMTAFFSLFVLLVVLLLGGLAENGVFAASGVRSLGDVIPGVRQLSVDSFGNALSFGAILGFLAAIFGGWLGGLLAPSQAVLAAAPVVAAPGRLAPVNRPVTQTRTERRVISDKPARVIPAYGRKGGDRVDEHVDDRVDEPVNEHVDEVHTTRIDRTDPTIRD
jgi:hypothetical protein